jgi:transposase
MNWTVAIGVDTHRDTHAASALSPLGAPLAQLEVPSTIEGYQQLIGWARSLGEPAFAIEGTASYGAGLLSAVVDAGHPVYEVARPERQERQAGKSDPIDAELAAGKLLSGRGLSVPRGGGQRDQLRVLLNERESAQQACTAALNELQALRVTAPPALREQLPGRTGRQLARHLLRNEEPNPTVLGGVLRRLATRIAQLIEEIKSTDTEIARITSELAPDLLAEHGFGTFTVAQTLVSAGDPRRLRRKDASLARLAGTCPIPASSGKTTRHRLNRGGDQQLNRAIHVVALTRLRSHPETRDYYQRLQADGKTKREAIRCIKRALTRRIYNLIIENPKLHYADA